MTEVVLPRKVVLSAHEVEVCRLLGRPLEDYARFKVQYESQGPAKKNCRISAVGKFGFGGRRDD